MKALSAIALIANAHIKKSNEGEMKNEEIDELYMKLIIQGNHIRAMELLDSIDGLK